MLEDGCLYYSLRLDCLRDDSNIKILHNPMICFMIFHTETQKGPCDVSLFVSSYFSSTAIVLISLYTS